MLAVFHSTHENINNYARFCERQNDGFITQGSILSSHAFHRGSIYLTIIRSCFAQNSLLRIHLKNGGQLLHGNRIIQYL